MEENKGRQENLAPGERQPLHFSHLCKAAQQPRPWTNSLPHHHVFTVACFLRESPAELDKVSGNLCDEACLDTMSPW